MREPIDQDRALASRIDQDRALASALAMSRLRDRRKRGDAAEDRRSVSWARWAPTPLDVAGFSCLGYAGSVISLSTWASLSGYPPHIVSAAVSAWFMTGSSAFVFAGLSYPWAAWAAFLRGGAPSSGVRDKG
jgi:hypothetical protein